MRLPRTRAFLSHSWPTEMLPEVSACEREIQAETGRIWALEHLRDTAEAWVEAHDRLIAAAGHISVDPDLVPLAVADGDCAEQLRTALAQLRLVKGATALKGNKP